MILQQFPPVFNNFGISEKKGAMIRMNTEELVTEDDIAAIEDELSRSYYALGRSVYETAERKIDEINHLTDKLVETKIKLSQLKGRRVCAECKAQNPEDSIYCGKCGNKLP